MTSQGASTDHIDNQGGGGLKSPQKNTSAILKVSAWGRGFKNPKFWLHPLI